MRENDTTDARAGDSDARAGDSPEPGGASPRRRQFLKGMAIPPTVAALAGCARFGVGRDDSDAIVEDLEPGDVTGFPGAIRFGDRYAMEVSRGADGTRVLSGRFHHEDRVLEFADDGAGNAVTSYLVDGDGYVVTAGECVEYPEVAAALDSVAEFDPENASTATGTPEVTVTGKTTIDGRETLVFEPAQGAPADTGQRVTYYADVETRYLRRIEAGSVTVDYHAWTEVEPIEAPASDCRQAGEASIEESNR